MLAAARLSLVIQVGAHGPEQGQAGLVVRLIAAHQNGQCAVFRPGVAAGDRRVQHMEAPGRALSVQPLRQRGAGGGHVDEIRPLVRAVQEIARLEVDLLHVLRIAHNRDDGVPARRAGGDAVMEDRALLHHVPHLLRMAGVDVYLKALLHQIADHGFSHDAHADKPDFFHAATAPFALMLSGCYFTVLRFFLPVQSS